MKKNQLITILTVLLALVCFALPAMAEDEQNRFVYGGKYEVPGNPSVIVDGYPQEWSEKKFMYPTPMKNGLDVPGKTETQGGALYKLFHLIDTWLVENADDETKKKPFYASIPVYCFDYDIHAAPGATYEVVELTGSGLDNINAGEVRKLRGILKNSYPQVADMAQITNQVNAWLANHPELQDSKHRFVENLNVQECILSTQSAIWHFTNDIDVVEHVNGRNYDIINPNDCLYDFITQFVEDHGYDGTEWSKTNSRYLYEYLVAADGVPAADAVVLPNYEITITSAKLIEQIDKTYDAVVTVELNDVPSTGTPLSIKVKYGSYGPVEVTTRPGQKVYSVTLENVQPVAGQHVAAELSGTQQFEDLYMFKGELNNVESQAMGGFMKFNHKTEKNTSVEPTKQSLQATIKLNATKNITNRNFKPGDAFTFEITAPNGAPLPENCTATIRPSQHNVHGIQFGTITYTTANLGENVYYITETNTGIGGISYDTAKIKVVVTVGSNANGQFEAKVTSIQKMIDNTTTNVDKVEFTNTYNATGNVQLKAKKTLTGRQIEAGQFRFQLKDGDRTVLQTKTNDADGNVNFDTISYDEKAIGKTFIYYIQEEVNEKKPGYTYDEKEYEIEVEVTDNGDGTLKATIKGDSDVVGIKNTYTVKPAYYAPEVCKLLHGEEPTDPATFTFVLTADPYNPADGAVMSETTASVKGAGAAAFGTITFKKEGTYKFTIAEVKENANAYEYDTTPWELTVVIEDVDSQLTKKSTQYVQLQEDGEINPKWALFTNKFAPEPTSFAPVVSKIVTGVPLKAETHVFAISEVGEHKAGSVAMPLDPTASVTGAGTAQFGAIEFRSKGVYTFKITEIAGSNPACKYSDHEWLLTVTVTETDGILYATGMYESNDNPDAATPKFENFYKPGGITVTKTVTGKQIDKQVPFTFALKVLLEDGTMHDGVYEYTITSEDGLKVAGGTLENGGTFELKHGERIVVDGMPVGATYQVEELDANKNGYTTASVNEVGKVMLDELAEVEFINHMLPVTGDHDQPLLYAALCLLALMGMCQLRKKHC